MLVKYKKIIVLSLFAMLQFKMSHAQHVGIIPQPKSVEVGKDSLVIEKTINLYDSKISNSTLQYLKKHLFNRFKIYTNSNTANPSFIRFEVFKKSRTLIQKEAYELKVSSEGVVITANSEQGYFNGINSLLQLLQFHKQNKSIKLPSLSIKDEPAFEWRGFMLDESRHFFGRAKVKQLLDYMAYYKLNKFHWHLTDEPAWRIEIKQYPFLTLIGGIGTYIDPTVKAQYYTQDDIRDIVAYALQRQIEVVPEIDMPGHATAANKAYPQFSGGGTKEHPDFTFHPAKEGTYQYLTNILKETKMLFPTNKLHLGGDEVAFGSAAWDSDKSIQELKSKYGYKTSKEVEVHFMKRMADSVYNMGADLVVWDEMADSGLPKDKTIQMWWRHDKVSQLDLALKNGYRAVISPRLPFYFDFVQHDSHRFGRKWNGFNDIESVYNYNLEGLKSKQIYENQILGVQANLWTERIHNEQRLDFMVFPRIAALAETAWTKQDRKSFAEFSKVVKNHFQLYKADGIYYYDFFTGNTIEPSVPSISKNYIDSPE